MALDGITLNHKISPSGSLRPHQCETLLNFRIFSLLNCTFDDHQHQALNDYKEASIRIRYNENFRDRKQY